MSLEALWCDSERPSGVILKALVCDSERCVCFTDSIGVTSVAAVDAVDLVACSCLVFVTAYLKK